MIYESSFWKEDLIKLASKLEKRSCQKRWTERSFATVEKEVLIGFYIVRKLIESKKISDSLTIKKIPLFRYPIKDTKINLRLIDYWQRLYDLSNEEKCFLDVNKLCNQFIHSYIFHPHIKKENSLDGFAICSDWAKSKYIYYVKLNQVVHVFKSIGNNYPSTSKFTFNIDKGEYDIEQE